MPDPNSPEQETTSEGQAPEKADGANSDPKPEGDSSEGYYRRQFEKSQKRIKDLERASMSELDRSRAEANEWKTRAEQAETKLRAREMRFAFESVAVKAGVRDPEAAFLLADHSKLTLTDEGKLVGAQAAIQQLKQDRPYLFEAEGRLGSSGGKGKGGDSGPSIGERMNQEIRRQALGG